MQESFLISTLEKFSFKLKVQELSSKKVYPVDTGLINEVAFQLMDNAGRLMEVVVCLELQRRKSYNKNKMEIFYWQNYQDQEVDFVIKKGAKIKQLIQVSHSLDNEMTKKREIRSLLKGGKELRCDELVIITRNDEGEIVVDNKKIKVIPIWKWLMDDSV